MQPFDFPVGNGRRETVVLLHSSGSSSRQWQALAERLRPRHDVYAVDLHGHGMCEAWRDPRPLQLADEAALVAPIVKKAGSVHLVGHSYGGAVALKVAQLYPRAVRSLTVYEPVLFRRLYNDDPHSEPMRGVFAVANAVRQALHQRSYTGAAAPFVNYWGGAGAWDAIGDAQRQAIAARMHSVMLQFDALFTEDPSDLLRQSPLPMLFLSGGATVASTRRISALLQAAFPGKLHTTLGGMGHMGPITHPEVVNRWIERFVRGAGVDGGVEVRQAA